MKKLLTFVPLFALLFALAACGTEDGSGGGGGSDSGSATFALTDAPSDELSVFQIELTKVTIFDTAGTPTPVFPATAAQTKVVNLLSLRGIHHLLGNVALPKASYDKIEMSFIDAIAVDTSGNRLTVNPSTSGTVTIMLQPALSVTGGNMFFEIDFDVDNSVSNLVTGPGGSLTLNPVVIARVDDSPSGQHIEDFKGVVNSVASMSMNVSLGTGSVAVVLDANTQVESNGAFISAGSAGFDLTNYIMVNDIVEVAGTFNAGANAVTATFIELEDGLSSFDGPEGQGVVTAIGTGSFDMIVTDSRDSGFNPGSTVTITTSGTTVYKWDDPRGPAVASDLRIGMEVRVTGQEASPADALEVKLRDTEIRGTITAVDAGLLQATMNVSHIEGIGVSTFAGFSNPVTLQFTTAIPAGISVNAFAEVKGHFDRTTNGVFDVTRIDNEVHHIHQVEGNVFSVVSSNPLTLSITGVFEGPAGISIETITVELTSNCEIIEQDDALDITTLISASELEARINAGDYVELEAEGEYDSGTGILTASKVKAEKN